MSKDRGVKNIKKAPADRSTGKAKVVSAYKSESKSGYGVPPAQKTEPKKEGNKKP